MSEAEIRARLRGYSSENYDMAIVNGIPSLKFDRIRTHLRLSRLELNILLAIHIRSGIQIKHLKDVISTLSWNVVVLPALVRSSLIREEKRVGKSSFQSSRKFYLTGKGKEIVRVYYELMDSK